MSSKKSNTEEVIVPIEKLTIQELNEKVAEIAEMEEEISQHIKELKRYLAERSAKNEE